MSSFTASPGNRPEVTRAEPSPAPRWALASLSLAMLLASLGISIANIALPTLALAFAAPFQQVQWVILAYLLASTILVVGLGGLGDRLGRRRLLLTGIGLFTLAATLCAMAPTLPLLIAGRALQGAGAAMMMAHTLALVGEIVPKPRIGGAMGLLATMSAAGTALGPSLGGLLLAAFGWPAVFLASAPLGLAALLLAWRHLPRDRQVDAGRRPGFDAQGMLLLTLTLAAYALAMTLGRGSYGPANAALLLAAALGALLFLRRERRAPAPLIRLASLREPLLATSLATSGLAATVVMATLVVGPFYLAQALGLDSVSVGLAVAVGPLVVAVAAAPAGRLVDRRGARPVMLAGLAIMATGALALALLPASLGVPGYVGPLALLTLGYAGFHTANNTAVMAEAPQEQRGVFSGLLSLSRNLGLITGAAAMGAIFARAAGTPDLAAAGQAALADGLRATFAVAAALILGALVLARRLRPPASAPL